MLFTCIIKYYLSKKNKNNRLNFIIFAHGLTFSYFHKRDSCNCRYKGKESNAYKKESFIKKFVTKFCCCFFSNKKQQSHLQQLLEQTANQQKETSHKSQQELKQMSMKTQQDNNVVEQLKAIVAEKEAKVHRLEDEIQQLKLNVSAYLALF